MHVGCCQWGSPASTMVPQYHIGSFWFNLSTPFFQKITPPPPEQVLQCKGAPICPSRVYECAQTLHMPIQSIWMCSNTSYTSNMDVGCSLGPLAASTMTPQRHLAQPYPTWTDVTVRLDPYAQPQHMNVLKHFIYLQYGCGMQTARVCSHQPRHHTVIGAPSHRNVAKLELGPPPWHNV